MSLDIVILLIFEYTENKWKVEAGLRKSDYIVKGEYQGNIFYIRTVLLSSLMNLIRWSYLCSLLRSYLSLLDSWSLWTFLWLSLDSSLWSLQKSWWAEHTSFLCRKWAFKFGELWSRIGIFTSDTVTPIRGGYTVGDQHLAQNEGGPGGLVVR